MPKSPGFRALLATVSVAIAVMLSACSGASPTSTPLPPTATAVPTATPRPASTATALPPATATRPAATPAPPPVSFDIVATDNKFDQTSLEVTAGQKVTIKLISKAVQNRHNFYVHGYEALDRLFGDPLDVGASRSTEVTFDKPGYYTFFCPVSTHENQGEIGLLRVKGAATGPPTIKVGAPKANSAIRGNPATVLVNVSVTGFELDKASIGGANRPGSGNWHLLLDDKDVATSGDIFATLRGVPVGTHTVTAELRTNDNSPLTPPVTDTVVFTVTAPPTPSPQTPTPPR